MMRTVPMTTLNNTKPALPLDSLFAHEQLLTSAKLKSDHASLILRLFGITPPSHAIHQLEYSPTAAQNCIRVKPYEGLAHNLGASYIQPYLVDAIASKNKLTNFKLTSIMHSWREGNVSNIGSLSKEWLRGTPSLIYSGDEQKLLKKIFDMKPVWDHKNQCFQLSFLLPISNNDISGIDHYMLSKEDTMSLLSTTEGAISLVVVLQSLGLTTEFIEPLLVHTNLLDSNSEVFEKYLLGFRLGERACSDAKRLMDRPDQLCIDKKTPIITNTAGVNTEIFGKFSGRKYHKSEGKKLTEKDLIGVRQTMSYLLTHNSCVAITLNLPLSEDKRKKKGAIPQIVMPYWWAETIKAMRPLNQKHSGKEQKGLHKYFVQQLLDQDFKIDSKILPHSYPHPDSFIS